jgi:Lrp/AsnC family leucine-responsive transcriptional regulator
LQQIRRLEVSGVIRQYIALLDPEMIGLGPLACVNVRLEKRCEGSPDMRSVNAALADFSASVMG